MKLYRKLAALGLAAAMAVGMAVTASAASPVTVTVNGTDVTASAYINDDWRTMVSTDIADDLGLTSTVSGSSVTFTDGTTSQTYTVDTAVGSTAPELTDGVIYVPFAHLAQAFGYTVGWDGAAGVASAQKAEETLTVDDIASIQAYTDETIYGTGVVEVVVTYKDGVDLSGVTADSYILEDRGSLSPDYGQIAIESAAVDGQTVTLTISDASQATARNALVYTGEDAGARQLRSADYGEYDLLVGMDQANLRNMRRICGGDPDGKLHLLLEYAGRPGQEVADPWYTGDFEATWRDVLAGCQGLLDNLLEKWERASY